MRGNASALALLLFCAPGCDQQASTSGREVPPLVVPSDAEREAAVRIDEATALLAAGRDRQAEAPLRRALELSPDHPKALSLLAGALLRRRKFDEAAERLVRLVAVSPDDVAARADLVTALTGRGDLRGAENAARGWTKLTRDSSDAWYALGCALHELGRLDEAVPALQQASTLKAARADVRSRLGLVYQAQGRFAEAEAAQRDAIQREARNGEAWFRLAELLFVAKPPRLAEAIAAYRHASHDDPTRFAFAHVHLWRAMRLASAEEGASAEDLDAEWKTLLRVAGRDMLPWAGLGAPPGPGDQAKEERSLREAVTANPGDARTRLKLALTLHRRGEIDAAIEEYAEAALGTPQDARLRSALGAAWLVKGDAESAEPHLREAVRLDPSDQTTWRNLGWALVHLRRDADAVKALDEALRLLPTDPLAHRARGLARMHAGELEPGLAEIAATGWFGR